MRFLLAALLLLSAPALAAPEKVESEVLTPLAGQKAPQGTAPQAPAPQEDAPATPEEQAALICQAAGVMSEVAGPDYQPGVDAYGKPVVPAEGPNAGPQYDVPERVDIPLDINVLETLGIVMQPAADLKANVGTLTILKGGQVLYNGQDMSNTVQGYCNKHNIQTPEAEQ